MSANNKIGEAFRKNPTDPSVAKAYWGPDLLEDSDLKLFRVTLRGPMGVTYDAILPAGNLEEAFDSAIETMLMLRSGDFDCEGHEVK